SLTEKDLSPLSNCGRKTIATIVTLQQEHGKEPEPELSARDFYLKLCKDPSLEKEEKKILNDIANDEQEHIKIVQEIISLINSNL
ncbi:MAG: hypothetical protein ACYSRZ_05945, partial [Planctomycetota bacterium]